MDTIKKIPGLQYHPKVAGAGPEQVRRLAGSIALRGPIPSWKFLERDQPAQADERARD